MSTASLRIPYLLNNQTCTGDTLPPHNVGHCPHLTTNVPSNTIPHNIPSDTHTYDSDITVDRTITTPSCKNTSIPQNTVIPNNNTVIPNNNTVIPNNNTVIPNNNTNINPTN